MANEMKDTLTENDVNNLSNVAKMVVEAVNKAKQGDSEDGKELLEEAATFERRVANLKRDRKKPELLGKTPRDWPEYTKCKTDVLEFQKKAKVQLEALAKKPTVVYKFGTETVADDQALIAKIKAKLPTSGHGNINQALNDVILGRGKATTGHSGVLHASAGPQQKGKGCTLFFKRSGKTVEIVGVGQHEEVKSGQKPKYFIYYGLGMEKKVLSL
jgi:hypothetical protein